MLPVRHHLRPSVRDARRAQGLPFSWEGRQGLFYHRDRRDDLCADFLPDASSSGLRVRHAISGTYPWLLRHRITLALRLSANVSDTIHLCKRGYDVPYPWAEHLCAANQAPFGDRVEQKREQSKDCTCRSFG